MPREVFQHAAAGVSTRRGRYFNKPWNVSCFDTVRKIFQHYGSASFTKQACCRGSSPDLGHIRCSSTSHEVFQQLMFPHIRCFSTSQEVFQKLTLPHIMCFNTSHEVFQQFTLPRIRCSSTSQKVFQHLHVTAQKVFQHIP